MGHFRKDRCELVAKFVVVVVGKMTDCTQKQDLNSVVQVLLRTPPENHSFLMKSDWFSNQLF